MKQHRYRITVEHLADAKGQPSSYESPLQFEVGNHDDLFLLVERVRQRQVFDEAASTAFVVGLKLFGEVLLENKNAPLSKALSPHFSEVMKVIKGTAPR
jgi:hypothetical protein